MKGVNFVKKSSSEIFERIEGNFFKIFCLKIYFPKIFVPPIFVTQIFAPPNIYDKSTPVSSIIVSETSRGFDAMAGKMKQDKLVMHLPVSMSKLFNSWKWQHFER